ncbi:MAG: TolC family protein [Bacteroidales bacterium]|nr:TolC family protein [Bacteroidales bacterium]
MKTTAYRKLLITFFALGSWLVSHSQQYPDSLIKYLEIAAKNNPAVLQKFSEYQAALQKIPQVGSLSDPELSLGVFLKPMELVNGNQVADIRLMQMFPWFGVLKNAKDEMSLMGNAKYELFRDAKLQVFYDVQRTWYDLYKIQKDISISEKNIEILKIIERLALVRFKSAPSGSAGTTSSTTSMSSGSSQTSSAGSSGMQTMGSGQGNSGSSASNQPAASMQNATMGSSSGSSGLADLYRIQIETGELENNIALLKNQEQSIIALFNSYLNRPPLAPVFTSEALAADSLGLSLIAVSDSILAKNPMLSMLEFEKQSIDAHKKMVTAMGYPMVGLGMNYSLISKNAMSTSSMNGKDMVMPMVTVTLPIYRKKYNAMVKEADLLKNATSQNYQVVANSLQTDYYQAVQLYQDALRRVKLYENQHKLASKSLDLILKSFSTSSSGLTDVLRVRQQTLDYELKQVEALADLNTAVAWLNRLMAFSQIK